MDPVKIGVQQKTVRVNADPLPRPLYQPLAGWPLSKLQARDGVVFFTTALVELTGSLDFVDLYAQCSEETDVVLQPRWWLSDRPIFAGLVSKTGDVARNYRLEVLPVEQFEAFHSWLRNMAVYNRAVDYFRRFAWGSVSVPDLSGSPEHGVLSVPYVQAATNRGCFTMGDGEPGCSSRVLFSQDIPSEILEFAARLRGGLSDLYGVRSS